MFIPKGFSSLFRNVPDILEDGDNDVPDMFRATLYLMYQRLLENLRAGNSLEFKRYEDRWLNAKIEKCSYEYRSRERIA